jgi:CO/xanthine dehydrogenase FAD-binding subunit
MTTASQSAYAAPKTLEEAAGIMVGGGSAALSGGTDLLPRWSKGLTQRPDVLVDLKRIDDLAGVTRGSGDVCIGACTTLTDVASDRIITYAAPVLAQAAGRVACPQIRNRATIGGNLCNASPAADTAVPLILLDAMLELVSTGPDGLAFREVPVADFFKGPGETVLQYGEILARIKFKPLSPDTFAAWDKFGTRPSMEIAVASVGLALKQDGGKVTHARVGYGSVAPIPLRGRKAEEELMGKTLSPAAIAACAVAARAEVAPITDVRAGEDFRREIVAVTLRRMLEDARNG